MQCRCVRVTIVSIESDLILAIFLECVRRLQLVVVTLVYESSDGCSFCCSSWWFGPAGPGAMEYKSIDTRMNATALDNGSSVLLLNGCARGDDINERTGRRTTMASLEAKIYTYATTTTGASQIHRHLLVLDTQPNGSALTALQVLSAADTFSSRNLENRARFRVLMDRRFRCLLPP